MKPLYKLAIGIITTMAVASCQKYESLEYTVNKPASFGSQELIDGYQPLKTYIDRTANPKFKLGAGIGLQPYLSKGVLYRLANSNFDEITLGYEMKHGAVVQADGSLALTNVKSLLEAASKAGMSVFGHTLIWHSNQNANYLKGLIAPIVTPSTGGPTWDLVTGADFESATATNYQTNTNAVTSFTQAGEGFNNTGRALKINNAAVRTNDYDAQLFLSFPAVVLGEKYELKMNVRSDAAASYSTQAHVTPGAYKHYEFFGTISSTPTWTTYTKEVTITAEMATSGTIAFNLGKTATNYYFDNITLKKYNPNGGTTIVEKTAEQKKTLLTNALDKWINGIVTTSKDYVKAWDVVNEPMDDAKPYELKTAAGRTNIPADEFYWQDYLGKDYALKAFQLARQYGNATDLHFINDYNLESNIDKCKGLIAYVKYLEERGAKIDGIGTQMHIVATSDKSKIDEMLVLLAATGKQIKISELDMGFAGNIKTAQATAQQYALQADMYKYVIKKYFELIPAAQRYGITIWSPQDSPEGSSWRAGEPIGLWSESLIRKPAYVGVADGLKNK
ncbi:endo-1,4-beta-xylanase [Pedobacter duraquae]|uniref:Beta-xylanase n=1 Tax=Pedobacter duraquae TaxID=425511 RepID=A0A4R6IQN6_9SPHI|nr:endo-1,4-beta-xylanase [Pedobacter duraquae]TDO24613.1 carbohydrate binding protein [Pedobacter duraquae]